MPQGQPIELEPPLGGLKGDVVPYRIPPGYLWRSSNVVSRYGRVRTRPGLSRATSGPLLFGSGTSTRLSGGVYFKNASSSGQVLAASLQKWYKLLGDGWTDISGAKTFTNDADNPTRFAVFPSAGVNYAIGVNNVDVPYKWDGTSATIAVVGGTPPIAKDVTVAGNLVILGNVIEAGVRSSSRLRVSDFNNLDSWTQYGPADLTDTNDDIVAVRALTRTSFAIYKDKSIWMAWAQLGLFPFQLETVEYRPGPVSPAAVVRVDQEHYYLGTDSRIHKFNGLSAQIVSGPIESYLQDIRLASAFRAVSRTRCFGFFNSYDRTVWFFYPGNLSADPTLAVSYQVDTGQLYLHNFGITLTAGWEGDDIATLAWSDLTGSWNAIGPGTYPTWDSFGGTLQNTAFLGSVSAQIYRQKYDADDDGLAIAQTWELPLKPWLGMAKNSHIDGVENFFEQTTSGPVVSVSIGVSDAIAETPDPSYAALGTHDTSLATRQKLALPSIDARFWSIKYAVSSRTPVKWSGGMANAWPQEVPEQQAGALSPAVITSVTPSVGATQVVVVGTFATPYLVLYNTTWATEVRIDNAIASGFTMTFTVPCPAGGIVLYKVES